MSPMEREARNAKGSLISSSLPEPGRHVFLAHAVTLKEEPQREGCVSHMRTPSLSLGIMIHKGRHVSSVIVVRGRKSVPARCERRQDTVAI